MNIKISTGNCEILSTGTVVSNKDEPIEFSISELTFIIEFRTDVLNVESKIDKIAIDPRSMKIVLINFNNPLGIRSTSSMPIGTLDNRKLLLNFSARSTSETTGHIFHYSFLLEKLPRDGE